MYAIRSYYGDHRLQIAQVGAHLVVVGRDVAGDIELLAHVVGFFDGRRHHVQVVEFVVAHPQAVARLSYNFV